MISGLAPAFKSVDQFLDVDEDRRDIVGELLLGKLGIF